MGITLFGIVECKDGPDGWWKVAEIEFNKNHRFRWRVQKHATHGWPDKVGFAARDMEQRGVDTGLAWCDLTTLAMLLTDNAMDDEEDDSEFVNRFQPKAVRAFMASLEEDSGAGTTRILFYEM